jgi:protein phosphatase 1 regulatory subunit 14B
MQCGVETMNDCERSPGRQGLRVNFTEKGEVKERREKFLTAKYGSHQMSLIRKRLAVEMWLYDELQKLFDPPVSSLSTPLRHRDGL